MPSTPPRPAAEYSHIIVGGGSAGCVLANRLSAVGANRVLLIEAGRDTPPGDVPADIADPYAGRAAMNPDYLWNGLRAHLGADERGEAASVARYEQARVMGGGSAINGQVVTRGAPSDYDGWARLGAEGWDWRGVLPYFKRVEHDADFADDLHGDRGPIPIRRIPRAQWDGFSRAVAAALEQRQFRFLPDMNGGYAEGFSPLPINTLDGSRVSSAIAYLDAAARARPNLRILARTAATRLLFDGSRAVAIEVERDGRSETIAGGEIIVSGGAIHSPTLLLRSGIGSAAPLRELGIAVVRDLPGVGGNLQEHPAIHVSAYLLPRARMTAHTRRHNCLYLRYCSGHGETPEPDMLLNIACRSGWHAVGERLGTMQAYLLQPYSRGALRLRSADPALPPEIRFDMLADARDLERLKDAARRMVALFRDAAVASVACDPFATCYSDRVRKIGRVTAWNRTRTRALAALLDLPGPIRRRVIDGLVNEAPALDALLADDAALEAHIRKTVTGVWHPTGTCRMGRAEDRAAVTDAAGRVHGIAGLRVADASIMPEIPRANTALPSMMIGERIADLILAGR